MNELDLKYIKPEQIINISRRIQINETFYYKGHFLEYDYFKKTLLMSDRKLGLIEIPFNEILRIEIIERIL